MSFLSRVLSLPLRLIKSPAQFVSEIWQDGGRGQFLVLGMPAVIIFVLGVTALGLAYSNDNKLGVRYESLAQRAREKAQQIRGDMQNDVPGQGISAVPEEDERWQQLKDEQKKEKIFLEKLISLQAEDPEHKFNLAMLAFQEGDPQRGESLMQVIAPFDEPGYAKAHLFLAEFYLRRKHRTEDAKRIDRQRAERQIDNALIADEANNDAKKVKAFILNQKRQFLQAYQIYQDLFETDPIYYRELLRLATILNEDADRTNILDRAAYQFRQKINKSPDNVAEWVDAWTHYVLCMKFKGEFSTAERALKSEIENFREDVGKEVFLKRQLSRVYSDRAMSLGRNSNADVQKQQLSDLSKAIENDSKNVAALQWLTILGFSPAVGEDARKIYDPRYDPNTPWVVLSELGHQALGNEDIENAIIFFERARKKNPRNPQVLNNLAFAYLQSDNKNPEQALLLVDQAITYINNRNLGAQREEIISSFFDTRGVALMQLNRMEEAAAALEIAFRSRPNSTEIIEHLIECYVATGNERQAEAYRRRLEQLKKEEAAGETEKK